MGDWERCPGSGRYLPGSHTTPKDRKYLWALANPIIAPCTLGEGRKDEMSVCENQDPGSSSVSRGSLLWGTDVTLLNLQLMHTW